MYLDFLVKVPDVKGKITRKEKGGTVYVNYEVGRQYYPDRKYTIPKRMIIGKLCRGDETMMQPNQNYLTCFPDAELPEEKINPGRSSCIKIGTHAVIEWVLEEYRLPSYLGKHFDAKDLGLLQDLMAYSLVCENNAGQYYPDYAYNHALFSDGMRIYSDSKISSFLHEITDDQTVGFLNDWNGSQDHREKIYISYDSTNKNSQAGDLELVEYGKPKADTGDPIFNYAIAYDTKNAKPLFYEAYPGSITDVSQLEYMLGKAKGYGYENIGFVLDRGYFSKENIRTMDRYGYDFVLMVKGMSSLVDEPVLSHKGMFEDNRDYVIRRHRVYGMTVKRKLYADDERERYFHIYHSTGKEHGEREELENRLEKMEKAVEKLKEAQIPPGPGILKYYEPFCDEHGRLMAARERKDVVQRELRLCGYFVIVTSKKMTAAEAIDVYYSRDSSEKLFRGDKSYLGNKSMRVYSDESAEAKIFIEFMALIVRNRIYTKLKEEADRLENRPNFMTVPAALKELDKIEMVRGFDGIYRMDHAVTKTQKTILKAFGVDDGYIKERAKRIRERLMIADEIKKPEDNE